MYNRRMVRRWLPGVVGVLIGAILLAAGYWKFPVTPFSVPVKLISGETAVISGTLPSNAWVGSQADLQVMFQFTSPVKGNKAQIRAEIVMPYVTTVPGGQLTLNTDPAETTRLAWEITPNEKGDLDGTLWINCAVDGGEMQAVLARRFQLHALAFLGISAPWIRRIGLGFLILGTFYLAAFAGRQSRARK
jgi:hypothetical protein